MPFRHGYEKVKGPTGRVFMAPHPRKDATKDQIHMEEVIYAACRSSKARSADTPENKAYCARVSRSKSGA